MRKLHLSGLCLTAVAAASLLISCGREAGEAPRKPNIVFVFADDHAYQAISAYGSKINQTPNIDRLAEEGIRFDRCLVTNSICAPARGSSALRFGQTRVGQQVRVPAGRFKAT